MTERVHIEKRYGPRRETTSPVEDSRDGAAQIRGKISSFFTFIPVQQHFAPVQKYSLVNAVFWSPADRFGIFKVPFFAHFHY